MRQLSASAADLDPQACATDPKSAARRKSRAEKNGLEVPRGAAAFSKALGQASQATQKSVQSLLRGCEPIQTTPGAGYS